MPAAPDTELPLDPCRLERIDAGANCYRAYALERTRSLFGDYGVTRVWGRIGQRPRERTDWFATEGEAETHCARLEAAKVRRGYAPRR